jgi:hypothetical protein
VRGIGEDPEGLEIWNEPNLADRAHPGYRLEQIERVHRLHRHGQADAGAQASAQPVPGGRLGPHGPVVSAPQEADEADAPILDRRQ